jgi:hypothetical protein
VVEECYWGWHTSEKLEKLWALKSAVLMRIFAWDGGNLFKTPHDVMALHPL